MPGGSHEAERRPAASGAPAARDMARPEGKQVLVRLRGYSSYDNIPPGPAEVTDPVVHDTAGGQGTFDDPVTLAVPLGSDFDPGTRLYLPSVRRYGVVEDFDPGPPSADDVAVWVDGEGGSEGAVDACLDRSAGPTHAEVDPPPGRPVIPGPIFDGSCRLPAG
jgi:hypothetical protein